MQRGVRLIHGLRAAQLRPQVEALADAVVARLRQITAMRRGTQAIYGGHKPPQKAASAEHQSARPSLVACLAGDSGRPVWKASTISCSI
jgi:hypothetical protein